MQKIILDGHLGRDPKILTSTNTGKEFASFSLASNAYSKEGNLTTWYDVLVPPLVLERYRKNIFPHLSKGSYVFLTGDLSAAMKKGNDDVERMVLSVYADSISFGPGKKSEDGDGNKTEEPKKTEEVKVTQKKATKASKAPTEEAPESSDDDLPF
jgi:single stranded DNA-binding protein